MESNSKYLTSSLILILGLTSLFYGIQYYQLKKQVKTCAQNNVDANDNYNQLNYEFDSLVTDFRELEDSTLVLNNELESKRNELLQQKNEINSLIKKGNLNASELTQARKMIQQLKIEKDNLLGQIQQLNQQNLALQTENKNYSVTLDNMKKENQNLVAQSDSLSQEKEKLVEKNENLEIEKVQNAPKLSYGQVVPINHLSAEGVRYKRSGKEVDTRNSRKVEKIKINFATEKNPVVSTGEIDYLVRIIAPDGTVIYNEQRGSGNFVGAETGQGMKYTTKTSINYDGTSKNFSVFWIQDQAYMDGDYSVEIYNRNYKVGTTYFDLR